MRQPFDIGGSGLYLANRLSKVGRRRPRTPRGMGAVQSVRSSVSLDYKFNGLVIYDGVLRAELNTSVGDLWKYLERRADMAVAGAKQQVGVKSGNLMRSIHKRHTSQFSGQMIWIGSDTVSYAYAHHEGTRPHLITPKASNPKGKLIFMKGSRIIVTPRVNHPGTKPNPYLRDQLVHFRF
jgi:hypothetical protein